MFSREEQREIIDEGRALLESAITQLTLAQGARDWRRVHSIAHKLSGGIGSIAGCFIVAVGISVMQNLSLLVIPGEWSIGVTFFIFVIFMLFRPTGLFAAAR